MFEKKNVMVTARLLMLGLEFWNSNFCLEKWMTLGSEMILFKLFNGKDSRSDVI